MATGDGDAKKVAVRLLDQLPTEQLMQELRELGKLAGQRALSSVTDRAGAAGRRLVRTAAGKGKGLVSALPGVSAGGGAEQSGGGQGGGEGSAKVTNIVEEIDVGVPVSVAYNQWTRFTDFPQYMKKVEKVEQESDTELTWRAQILWSHREWRTTITDQVPDERIVWRSEGAKGHVDGAVTFHEISPNLTRILVVLEYHPQGFFEKTGNLWRAQGRRARLELKHFRRHVMTQTLLHPDEAAGWRGEIHDSEVAGDQASDEPAEPEQRTGRGDRSGTSRREPAGRGRRT